MGPTVVLDPPLDGALMGEEIFGPILPVIGYREIPEATKFVNATVRGRWRCIRSPKTRRSWPKSWPTPSPAAPR